MKVENLKLENALDQLQSVFPSAILSKVSISKRENTKRVTADLTTVAVIR